MDYLVVFLVVLFNRNRVLGLLLPPNDKVILAVIYVYLLHL